MKRPHLPRTFNELRDLLTVERDLGFQSGQRYEQTQVARLREDLKREQEQARLKAMQAMTNFTTQTASILESMARSLMSERNQL